jgi:hypothetical protein
VDSSKWRIKLGISLSGSLSGVEGEVCLILDAILFIFTFRLCLVFARSLGQDIWIYGPYINTWTMSKGPALPIYFMYRINVYYRCEMPVYWGWDEILRVQCREM